MNINDNKVHGFHHFMNQIQSLHDFVYGIIRGLPSTNHDGTLTQGSLGDPIFELPDNKGNALVHHLVQIGRDTCHLRHHANLKNQTKTISQCQGHEKKKKKNHSPTTGDPTSDGNGGSYWSWEHAIVLWLGSNASLRLGAWDTLSWSIGATLWSLAPPSCVCPWCRNTPPKT